MNFLEGINLSVFEIVVVFIFLFQYFMLCNILTRVSYLCMSIWKVPLEYTVLQGNLCVASGDFVFETRQYLSVFLCVSVWRRKLFVSLCGGSSNKSELQDSAGEISLKLIITCAFLGGNKAVSLEYSTSSPPQSPTKQ